GSRSARAGIAGRLRRLHSGRPLCVRFGHGLQRLFPSASRCLGHSRRAVTAPVGIIGGTALARLTGLEGNGAKTVQTDYGPTSGPLMTGFLGGREACFVMRHGPGHGIAPHAINYRANIAALAAAGCRQVIAVAAVGGITEAMTPGRVIIPPQLVDYSWGRAHTFHDARAVTSVQHLQRKRL